MFLTNQEVFNKVAKHLLTQNKKSQDIEQQCLYRGPYGLKCAIGFLIPDELYDPKYETNGVFGLKEMGFDFNIINIDWYQSSELLGALQRVHDCTFPSTWKNELRKVATIYGLRDISVLGEVIESVCY